MSYTPSVTDDQIFAALRGWILGAVVLDDCQQGPINRASMPQGNFAIMSPLNRSRLSLNTTAYPTTGTETNTLSFDYAVQLDLYGPAAGDALTVLYDSWYSDQTYNLLKPQGVSPLWADEPRFVPLIDGEKQYTSRWTTTIHLQFKPSITDVQDSASAVTINPANVINVDERYPG